MLLKKRINKILLFESKKKKYNKAVKFNFYFISLISPYVQNNLRFLNNYKNSSKKIIVKQSYIILTWFYYLSFLNQNKNTSYKIKIFIFPVCNKKFTLTKAPMAHKNWSKEQYSFKHYRFKITFFSTISEEWGLTDLNRSTMFILINKKHLPILETNLIFIKKINLFFFFNDFKFFNYYCFFNKSL